MSNKRIKKRLEHIFDNLQQAESETAESKIPEDISDVNPEKKKEKKVSRSQKKHAPGMGTTFSQQNIPDIGTRPLGLIPETLARIDQNQRANILTVPFRTDSNNWAILEAIHPQKEGLWSQEEQILVKQVADQLSLALENARLLVQSQQLASELQVLYEFGKDLSSQLDSAGVAESIFEHASKLLEIEDFYVSLFAQDTLIVSYPLVIENKKRVVMEDRVLGNNISDYIIQTKLPLLISENIRDTIKTLELELTFDEKKQEPKCILGVPLMIGERVIGTIILQSYLQTQLYNDHHVDLLVAIANQAATVFRNVELFDESQKHSSEVELLNEMARSIAQSLNQEEIIETIFNFAQRILDTSSFYIALYNPHEDKVTFPILLENGERLMMPERKAGNGLTEYVIRRGEPILIEENSAEKLSNLGVDAIGSISKCWLGVPMMMGNQPIGAIAIESYINPHAFNIHTRNLLISMASQSAIALENARLFEETSRRNVELETINEIVGSAASILNLKDVLLSVLQRVIPVIGFNGGLITLYNPVRKKLERFVRLGLPGDLHEAPGEGVGNSLSGVVFDNKDSFYVEDLRQGAPVDVSGEIQAGFHSYLGVPLEASGNILGTLCGFRRDAGPWSQSSLSLLRTIGRQIGFTIENANLLQQTQLRAEEAAAISDLGRALSSRLSLDQVLQEVYRGVSRLLDTSNFYIALFDQEKKENQFIINVTESELDKSIVRLPSDQGITGYIVKTKEQVFITGGVNQWLEDKGMDSVGEPAKSWMGLPLMIRDQILGVMAVQDYHSYDAYTENDLSLFSAIASQASIAIQNAILFEQILASENRFRDVSTISGDYIWETDLEWKYTYLSERVKDVIGYEPEEMLGRSDDQIYDHDEANRLSKLLFEEIHRNGRAVDIENEVIFKNGQRGFLLISAVPILDAQGNRTGYRGVNKNITERKYTENIQLSLRKISESALAAPDLYTLLHAIHVEIKKLMPARNMYIALYDERADLLSFPYHISEHDIPMISQKPGRNLASYVLKQGKSTLITPEKYKQMIKTGEISYEDQAGIDWLGVPLQSGNVNVGVIVVQTFSEQERLTHQDEETLNFLANQVAVAIERKRSELELHALFAAMTDVIIVYDKEGRYVRIAPTNPSLLIKPPEILLGKTIYEALPQDTHEPFMKAIQDAIQTNETVHLDYPLEIENKVYWFEASVSKLSEEEVFWVARDITARRDYEETLQRQNEYLAISAEIGRLVTSTLDLDTLFSRTVNLIRERFGFYHAAIFILEETGINAILKSATGKAGEEMLARGHLLQVGSRSVVGSASAKGEPLIVNDTTADPIHRPNPLLPDTRSEAAIPLRIGKRVIGVIDIQSTQVNAFTTDDINVLQTLSDQIAIAIDNARSYELAQEAITEMRELDQLKSQFLANMSHELRTPLNSIIGFSRVILKGIDGPVTELQEQDLSAIYNSGQHLLRLINDILDLSKIDAGKMELAFDDVNLPELLQSIIPTIGGLIKDKPIEIIQKISPNIPVFRADAIRLRQVILNLLSNAAKFTEEGSITITAEVQKTINGHPETIVKVTDTGPGIALEDQEKLFQPFSQVDSSPTRKTGGTGLGLSISQRLIELHGGRIYVQSQPNQGSTFYFTLPLPETRDGIINPEGLGDQKIILAIDDDLKVIKLYQQYLQSEGYKVISLPDASSALGYAKQLKPYAITLDIMMPGFDSWALLTELKNDIETRHIPVIVCSFLDEEDRGFNLGITDYLIKPIMGEDLINSIERLNGGNNIHEVLIIDENPKDLQLVRKIIEDSKYQAIQAQSGEEGLLLIENKKPDAVILDPFMPSMDGLAVLEKLRSEKGLMTIPVIVLTGLDLSQDQHKWIRDFGSNLLRKGDLSENELLVRLKEVLRRLEKD